MCIRDSKSINDPTNDKKIISTIKNQVDLNFKAIVDDRYIAMTCSIAKMITDRIKPEFRMHIHPSNNPTEISSSPKTPSNLTDYNNNTLTPTNISNLNSKTSVAYKSANPPSATSIKQTPKSLEKPTTTSNKWIHNIQIL